MPSARRLTQLEQPADFFAQTRVAVHGLRDDRIRPAWTVSRGLATLLISTIRMQTRLTTTQRSRLIALLSDPLGRATKKAFVDGDTPIPINQAESSGHNGLQETSRKRWQFWARRTLAWCSISRTNEISLATPKARRRTEVVVGNGFGRLRASQNFTSKLAMKLRPSWTMLRCLNSVLTGTL